MKKINSKLVEVSLFLHVLLVICLILFIVVTDEDWIAHAGLVVLLTSLISINCLYKLGRAIEKHNKKVFKKKTQIDIG